jgi:hypothetical protein
LAVAASLAIELVWLPQQCAELNAMDHLWKELKRRLAANRQFRTIDEGAEYAEHWVLRLSPQEARRKAGILSKNYWLKDFSKNFCRPTYALQPSPQLLSPLSRSCVRATSSRISSNNSAMNLKRSSHSAASTSHGLGSRSMNP